MPVEDSQEKSELLRDARKRVLVADDDEGMRELIGGVLDEAGYECIRVEDGLRALSCMASEYPFDLVFSDISMPGLDGIDVLRTVKSVTPTMPVVLISGEYEAATGLDALRSGAADYLYKPVRPAAIVEMAQKHLGPNVQRNESLFQEALSDLIDEAGASPLSAERVVELFATLGMKRYETLQHSRRVADYSCLLARRLGMGGEELEDLKLGALLHDVGKIAIPHNVLMKPGALNDDEWRVMRLHPVLGWDMLRPFGRLAPASEVVHYHHERWDGGGYPDGLEGRKIPLSARIFSAIDTFDAIVSDRPYRKRSPIPDARREIEKSAGTQFDPEITAAFSEVPELDLAQIRRRFPDPS